MMIDANRRKTKTPPRTLSLQLSYHKRDEPGCLGVDSKAIIHFVDYPREYKQINSSQSGKHTGIRLNGEEVEQSGDKL